MLKTHHDPELFPGLASRIWFHDRDRAVYPGPLLAAMTAKLRVTDGLPNGVGEFNDVFIVPGPGRFCLYDRDGRRIAESCVTRGEGAPEYIYADRERIDIPDSYRDIAEPMLFLSICFNHWGHFLLESLARLWARSTSRELGEMAVGFANVTRLVKYHPNVIAMLESLPFGSPNFGEFLGPARIAKCFVPAPSFVVRRSAHAAHLIAPREFAERRLGAMKIETSDQPVYFSRTRFRNGGRVIAEERELEETLARAGVAIVHPQELSLADQIVIFNRHKTFIGCIGSAFHNIVFALDGRRVTTHVLSQKWRNQNYLMMDAIVGNEAHYVSALRLAPTTPEGGDAEFRIDMPMALAYFRDAGIL